MKRQRSQAIIIQNMKVLFGEGLFSDGCYRHFFIGGGIEDNETPEEAVIREIKEEANVKAKVIFKLSEEYTENHHTFLVNIGEQIPILGFDPEEEERKKEFSKRTLQKLKFLPLDDFEKFTNIDIEYFQRLIYECNKRRYYPDWYELLKNLTITI